MSQRESRQHQEHSHEQHSHEPSPLTMPPARLREPSADDLEIDVSDPAYDLALDDSERTREDAEALKD
ncbi:MAG TPA: hypothetical protein VFZ66_12495 [Herpetosiphonaceae bacterium]